jgi:hypothetical protein
MPYAFDDQLDPLISMHIHGWLSDAELERVRADLDLLATRGRPFVVVLDCTGLRVPELAHVRQLAECVAEPSAQHCHRGVAFVINTPMLRGTLRGVLQTRPASIPRTVVDTPAAGRRWAEQQLERDQPSSQA